MQTKSVLTTGDVAKLCNVAPRTVSKWFDSGQLRGYRIPGSKDRRIPMEHLIRFMKAHGIPLNGLDAGATKVVVLDADPVVGQTIAQSLSTHDQYDAVAAASALETGMLLQEHTPQVVIIDVSRDDVCIEEFCRQVKSNPQFSGTWVIGVGPQLANGKCEALRQRGFDSCLSKPFEINALVELMGHRVVVAGE